VIISAKEKNNLSSLEKKIIKNALMQGKVIAFLTDTVYGIGANGYLYDAVCKIYKIKERDEQKSLTLLLPSIDKIRDYIEEEELLENEILKKYWPGPLTVVFKKRADLKIYFSKFPSETIGVRIPNYQLLLDLLSFIDLPLVTTSANISGSAPLKNGFEIEKILRRGENQVSIIIDGGEAKEDRPSTVISMTREGIKVLREGIIKIK